MCTSEPRREGRRLLGLHCQVTQESCYHNKNSSCLLFEDLGLELSDLRGHGCDRRGLNRSSKPQVSMERVTHEHVSRDTHDKDWLAGTRAMCQVMFGGPELECMSLQNKAVVKLGKYHQCYFQNISGI